MASTSLAADNTHDGASLSRRASSVLSLGSNPSLASTTDLTAERNPNVDEPPPYSAVDVPDNSISSAPAWANHDPRSASTESLVPAAAGNDTRRRLLLVYLNASPLPTCSFKSFPAHVHNLVSVLMADTHVVHTKIFPHVTPSKPISNATDDFSEWLIPREDARTDTILLANSLSGLPSAELALLQNENQTHISPLRHRLIGTINFDVPFLGFHPHASRVGRSNAVDVRSPNVASSAASDGATTVISIPNSLSSSQTQTISSSLAMCVQDMDLLKQRYCRIRLLDEANEQSRSSMTEDKRTPPRVRFANYHTACLARAPRPQPAVPSQLPEKPGLAPQPSSQIVDRLYSLSSIATRDTELPPYDMDDAEIIDEEDDDDDLDLISEVTFDDFDDLADLADLDDLDDPLHSRDDLTDADATLVNGEVSGTNKLTSSGDQTTLLGAPEMPAPPPMPPMLSQYPDRSAFKAAMRGWRQDLRTYHRNLGTYHRALRSWKRAEQMRLRAEYKADKHARKGEKQWAWHQYRQDGNLDTPDSKSYVPGTEDAAIEQISEQTPDQEQRAALQRLQQERKRAYEEHRETYLVACKGERSERRRLITQSNQQLKERLEAIKSEWKSVSDQTKIRGDQLKVERKLRQEKQKEERKRFQDLQKGERKLRQGLGKEERKLQQEKQKEEQKLKQEKEKEERKLQQDKEKEERKWQQEQEKEQRKRIQEKVKEQRKALEDAFKSREKIHGDLAREAIRAEWKQGKSWCSKEGRDNATCRSFASSSQPSLVQSTLPVRSSSEVMFDAAADQDSVAGPSSQYTGSVAESSQPQQISYPADSKGQPLRDAPQAPKMRTMCLLPPKDSVTGARDPCWIQIVVPSAKDELEAHSHLFMPAPDIEQSDSPSRWDKRYGTFVTDVASRIEQWAKEDSKVAKLPA